MIITIVSDVYGPLNNGTVITMHRLIEHLQERGHTVKVVCPGIEEKEGRYALPIRYIWPVNWYIKRNGVLLARINDKVLRKAIEGSDIVHIITAFRVGNRAAKIATEMGIPVTVATHTQAQNITAHFHVQNWNGLNIHIYKQFYRHLYKYAAHVHCPTEFIASQVRDCGFDMQLHVISNGVEPDYKKREVIANPLYKDKFCILTVGRLAPEKRHDILIEAVKLSKHEKDIQIFIAGCGPLYNKTKNWGKMLTNQPIIDFYPQEDLITLINRCDLYVHPADFEIEAISCIEAFTCGVVPIIANSEFSATRAFALHDENLFKARDPLDLAKKIDWMIEHSAEKNKMSTEYIEYGKSFSIEHSIDQMIEMFNAAVKDVKKS
ncbi:MAG: glycosyltransferase [Bacilli bacterium]